MSIREQFEKFDGGRDVSGHPIIVTPGESRCNRPGVENSFNLFFTRVCGCSQVNLAVPIE